MARKTAAERRLAASVKSMSKVKVQGGGPQTNIAAAQALRNDAAKLKSKLGRKRFAVGEERLLSMPGGSTTKRGQPNAAQIKATRQTAKNILGSSESGRSKGGKGKKR